MKRTNYLMLIVCFVAVLFTGCKKDDDDPDFEYKSQGYIKGTVTATLTDNSTFVENFNFTQYGSQDGLGGHSYYTMNTDGTYTFTLRRSDYRASGRAELKFTLDNVTDNDLNNDLNDDDRYFTFDFEKEKDATLTAFSFDSRDNNDDDMQNTLMITDFSFTPATGQVKGKFVTAGVSDEDKPATITGEFDVIARKIVR